MMPCPKCEHATTVTDSRPTHTPIGDQTTRRRRRCVRCAHSFTTYEVAADVFERLGAPTRLRTAIQQIREILNEAAE